MVTAYSMLCEPSDTLKTDSEFRTPILTVYLARSRCIVSYWQAELRQNTALAFVDSRLVRTHGLKSTAIWSMIRLIL
jgi:hypothetical protein